ncbi:PaaI family thioesterase [Paraconexibacter sp.]|uniref:PaaI family thioesterase n=1 Tax=Paraconexibacter sp. TaxID=2949640 RepID=UPI0035649849
MMAPGSHAFAWEDPSPTWLAAQRLSGLEIWQSVAAGELPRPPIAASMDFSIPEIEEGRVVFAADAAPWMLNPLGSVHGGAIATLLDSAVGCAIHTTLPVGVSYTTLELKVNYVRGVPHDAGTLHAEGTVIHVGRRTATADGRLTIAETGKLVAHASTTCLILAPPG